MSSLPVSPLPLRAKSLPLAAPDEWEACEACGTADATVDSDPLPKGEREYAWICAGCVDARNGGTLARADSEYERAKADRDAAADWQFDQARDDAWEAGR
jgi:hypothetical protein